MERYGGIHVPFSIPRKTAGLLSANDLARLLGGDGQDVFRIKERIRHYLGQGYMVPAAFDEETRAYLHHGDGILAAAVLLDMCGMGVKSGDAAQAMALAIYVWAAADAARNPDRAPSPGLQVIAEHAMGFRGWAAELWTFADAGGTVRFAARLNPRDRNTPTSWHSDVSSLTPRAVLAVDLTDVLDRIAARGVQH